MIVYAFFGAQKVATNNKAKKRHADMQWFCMTAVILQMLLLPKKVILVTHFWDLILQKLLTHAHLDSTLNNLCIFKPLIPDTRYWAYLKASSLFLHSSLTDRELIFPQYVNCKIKNKYKNFFFPKTSVNIGQVLLGSVLAIWRPGPNTSMLNWHISENQLK